MDMVVLTVCPSVTCILDDSDLIQCQSMKNQRSSIIIITFLLVLPASESTGPLSAQSSSKTRDLRVTAADLGKSCSSIYTLKLRYSRRDHVHSQ